MPTEKVKTNPKYQKKIDKSFAVIYHNLKRISDGKSTEAGRLEIMDPGSSSQCGKNRSYSSPSERTLRGTEYIFGNDKPKSNSLHSKTKISLLDARS